jgi:hypothetical protein
MNKELNFHNGLIEEEVQNRTKKYINEAEKILENIHLIKRSAPAEVYKSGESFEDMTERLIGVPLHNKSEIKGVEVWLLKVLKEGNYEKN